MQRKTILLIIASILLVILIGILALQRSAAPDVVVPVQQTPVPQTPVQTPVTITDTQIKERYYSGTKPVIAGSSAIAVAARNYVDTTVAEFAANAAAEVPDRKKEYGNDNSAGSYTIELHAKQVSGPSTDSIVIDSYIYMGGANGSSAYKVFTASKKTGELLSLSAVVKKESQNAFVALVKKSLMNMPSGGTFADDVNKLTLASLDDWSIDQNGTLTIYFDKYEVGAGALGAVALPLPSSAISSYLQLP
ncbi:MAG: RsiV family protein [Patescibacteria group bacterium]